MTGLGLSPGASRATVESSQQQKAIAPYSQTERSLLEMAETSPKAIASSSKALQMAQAEESNGAEEKEKKKKADSGVPKPVRMVLGLLRGRKTLLALSLISVLITGMAVFILLKLFDDGQPEYEEEDLPPELENLERSGEEEMAPELEEKDPYFEAKEPVFESEVEFPNARAAAVEEVTHFVEPDKSVTPPPPKISPLAEEEVVVPWQGLSEEIPEPTYQTENKNVSEQDNNGRGQTVLQPPADKEIDIEIDIEKEIQTKLQEEDSHTSSPRETSTPTMERDVKEIQTKLQEEDSHTSSPGETSTPTMEPDLVDRPQKIDRPEEESHPPDEVKDTAGRVSPRRDREPTDRHRADIELRKETAPSAPVDVVEQLIQQLQNTDTDAEDRKNAIWQLGEKGDSRAIEPLINMLRDSDSKQQSMILATLSQIGNKTLKPMVRALSLSLQNDNQEVRINAIRDLTDVYDAAISVSNILQYAVDDPDQDVRETAKWALEKLNRIRPPRNLDF
ncbi:MAG: HEAT repeat domain-containing protein [Cyanobacteriota bacterium]|nr:HEAT repeat domain-containing protein [Cyanobacteriota bacterium]